MGDKEERQVGDALDLEAHCTEAHCVYDVLSILSRASAYTFVSGMRR